MKQFSKFLTTFFLIPSFSFAAILPQGGEFIKGNGSIAYQGNKKDPAYQNLTDRIQEPAALDISDMQKDLDDELKKSKAIVRPDQLPHITKSDKKKRHKKKGKPKR